MPKYDLNTEFDADKIVSGSVKKALEAAGATKGELFYADPSQLRVIPGFNVRIETPDYIEHIDGLAQSMAANGFYPNKPLGGYAGKEDGADVIYVTDGHSRMKAVPIAIEKYGAEITKVPVVLKPAGQSIEDLTVALVQDNEGRPLSLMEKAVVAKRLISYGMEKLEIAKRFGTTDRHIDDLLLLAAAPAKIRTMVIESKVSGTLAVQEIRRKPEKALERLQEAIKTAAAQGKTRATAKHLSKEPKASTSQEPAAAEPNREKFVYDLKVGDEFETAYARKFARVIDEPFWEHPEGDKKKVVITQALKVTIIVERPAAPVTVADDENLSVDDDTAGLTAGLTADTGATSEQVGEVEEVEQPAGDAGEGAEVVEAEAEAASEPAAEEPAKAKGKKAKAATSETPAGDDTGL